jgi:hypothetical protein
VVTCGHWAGGSRKKKESPCTEEIRGGYNADYILNYVLCYVLSYVLSYVLGYVLSQVLSC